MFKDAQVRSIDRSSVQYPKLLTEIPDAPKTLYYLGDFKESLFKNTLAVVGSRAVTLYGEWVVNNLVKEVARQGITIVSGFMYGVDALAHKAALEVAGSTIAVMAGGVDQIFPNYQEQLYWDIVAKGLVVSEFYKEPELGNWMFAKRNRIVAGLSHATLVVEAAEKSGSLITACYTKEYGRQLLTVPANLNSKNAVGTTQLYRGGAKMVTCADDILALFSYNYRVNISDAVNRRLLLGEADGDARQDENPQYQVNSPENILNLLKLESLSADEITLKLGILSSDVLKYLTGLSLQGQVGEKGGRYYAC